MRVTLRVRFQAISPINVASWEINEGSMVANHEKLACMVWPVAYNASSSLFKLSPGKRVR
ncbi:hypothetical protein D3C75_1166130 [compost metagenome]